LEKMIVVTLRIVKIAIGFAKYFKLSLV